MVGVGGDKAVTDKGEGTYTGINREIERGTKPETETDKLTNIEPFDPQTYIDNIMTKLINKQKVNLMV